MGKSIEVVCKHREQRITTKFGTSYVRQTAVKHGMHDTPEHLAWRKMKDRCLNPRSQRYDRYGARGIKVCERWANSFENFFADMGPRPFPEMSIERVNNDGDYTPENCKWGTREEQNNNKSSSVFWELNGERLTVAQWSKRLGIGAKTLECRVNTGWSIEKTLTTPTEKRVWVALNRETPAAKMIYTLGKTSVYEQAFAENPSVKKLVGGSVWKSFDEAEVYRKSMETGEDFSVYGILADWDKHTHELESDREANCRSLKIDAIIVRNLFGRRRKRTK